MSPTGSNDSITKCYVILLKGFQQTDRLAADSDPERLANVLSAFLARDPDANGIYAVPRNSGSSVWNVSTGMGVYPDLGHKAHRATIIDVVDIRGRFPALKLVI